MINPKPCVLECRKGALLDPFGNGFESWSLSRHPKHLTQLSRDWTVNIAQMERKNVSVAEMSMWVDGSFLTLFTVSSANLCVAKEGVAIRVQTSPLMKQLMIFWVLFDELSEQRFWGRCGGCCRVWWPTVCRCKNLWQATRLKASYSLSSPHHYFPLEEVLYSPSAWDLVILDASRYVTHCYCGRVERCDRWKDGKCWQVCCCCHIQDQELGECFAIFPRWLFTDLGRRMLCHIPSVVVHRSWKLQVGGVFH